MCIRDRSVGAALIAGVYGVNGGSVNYGSEPYTDYNSSYLWDVTSGSHGNCGNLLCEATSGYDGSTGLGTPNGSAAFWFLAGRSAHPVKRFL